MRMPKDWQKLNKQIIKITTPSLNDWNKLPLLLHIYYFAKLLKAKKRKYNKINN